MLGHRCLNLKSCYTWKSLTICDHYSGDLSSSCAWYLATNRSSNLGLVLCCWYNFFDCSFYCLALLMRKSPISEEREAGLTPALLSWQKSSAALGHPCSLSTGIKLSWTMQNQCLKSLMKYYYTSAIFTSAVSRPRILWGLPSTLDLTGLGTTLISSPPGGCLPGHACG